MCNRGISKLREEEMSSIGKVFKLPSLAIIAVAIMLLITACVSSPTEPAATGPTSDETVSLEVIIDSEQARFITNPSADGNGKYPRGTKVTVDVSVIFMKDYTICLNAH